MLNNSFVVMDFYTNGFKENALIVISLISIFFGILVIISKNPIISVLFLISLFLCISFYLMLLGFNFLGISYLLVYIGAVSILFLFILMLINVRVSELLNETYNSILLSVIIAFSFNITISNIIPHNVYSFNKSSDENDKFIDLLDMKFKLNKDNNDNITYISSESWDTSLIDTSYIVSIGNILYSSYSIWLILTSIILLLAMVGCIIITIKQK